MSVRGLSETAWSAVVLASSSASLACALFVVDQRLHLSRGLSELAIWWWLRFFVFYLPVGLTAALGNMAVRRRPHVPRTQRILVAALPGAFALTVVLLNRRLIEQVGILPSQREVWWTAALLLALVGLATSLLRGRIGGSIKSTAALLSCVAIYAASLPQARERIEAPDAERLEAIRSAESDRLLVIGIDAADWRYMEPLIEDGELPAIAALRSEGSWGEVSTIRPTLSSALWTTMVTGRSPEEHGILRLTVLRPRGTAIGVQGRNLHVRGLGIRQVREALKRTGQLEKGPVTAAERRSPAIWNIYSHLSRPLSVSGWWATWPAEAVVGRIVSDRLFYEKAFAGAASRAGIRRLAFPEELAPRMRRLALRPAEVERSAWQRFFDLDESEVAAAGEPTGLTHEVRREFPLYYSMFESNLRFALELMREDESRGREPGDLFVLFRWIDQMSHCCLRFSTLVEDHLDAEAADLLRFGGAVSEAYRAMDEAVGQLVRRFGAGNVVLLSDHGFALESSRGGGREYAHATGPPGIFVASGPAFRAGRAQELSIFEVMPLLLYLKALPLAADMRGELRTDLLREDFLASHPPQTIASYEFVPFEVEPSERLPIDDQILQELRALGYIQ